MCNQETSRMKEAMFRVGPEPPLSPKLSSTCFEQLSVHHQEDCTSGFMVFYNAEIIMKLYELSRYKIFSLYSATKLIFDTKTVHTTLL